MELSSDRGSGQYFWGDVTLGVFRLDGFKSVTKGKGAPGEQENAQGTGGSADEQQQECRGF
jgi:hypothetical protein